MWETIMHVFWHAFVDSVKILPVLFLIYVLIEVIENKCATGWKNKSFLNNKLAPLIGSGVGIIPQCGFSVIATDLYAERKIAIGTLLAVYIATSDEAIPILLAESANLTTMKYLIFLIVIKFVYAIFIGYLVNFIASRVIKKRVLKLASNIDEDKESHNHDYGCCGHDITHEEPTFKKFILHPLYHSLKIFLFIFVINLIFGFVLEFVSIEQLSKYMLTNSIFQPFLVGLLGLIPNCASSVLITNMFLQDGLITFASCIAGLCVNAGVAIVVLFKANKNIKQNIFIISLLYITSTVLGFILQFLNI